MENEVISPSMAEQEILAFEVPKKSYPIVRELDSTSLSLYKLIIEWLDNRIDDLKDETKEYAEDKKESCVKATKEWNNDYRMLKTALESK